MIRFYACLFTLLLMNGLRGQALVATPGPELDCEAAPGQATECYIHITQPGGPDTLWLKWRRIEMNTPAGWDYDLCDYGQCYIGVPAQGEMWPATNGAEPYLKVIVQPGSTPGAGWLAFRVSEASDPDNFIDVYFSPHTPGVVATAQPEVGAVRAFPNPARDFIFLENTTGTPAVVRIRNVAGQPMWQSELPAHARIRVETAHWPAGAFLLEHGGRSRLFIKDLPTN